MEWQERLRKVDARLAAGEISAAEQRRLRDEILAEASGSGLPAMAAGPRWQAPGGTPPTVMSPFPGSHGEGQQVFAEAGKPRRTWVGALVVLVVLAIATGVVWWVAGREDPAPPTRATELGVERLPNPVTAPLSTSGEFSVAEGIEHGLLQKAEADLLNKAGTRRVDFRTAPEAKLTYQLFLFETETQDGAEQVRSGIISLGEEGGMVDAGIDGLPAGVAVTKASDPKVALMQAVYATEGGVVRIVILQTGERNDPGLVAALSATVRATTAELPVRAG